jgi:extracellular factor (EF) 3-hydroxypalmitic acid methyl ester biosynthesis protein
MSNTNPSPADNEITAVRFTNSTGTQLEGTAERLTRFEVVFDVFGPLVPLRLSEALESFTITIQGRTLYEGRATVRNLVPREVGVTCEVTLDETGWLDVSWQPGTAGEEFSAFMRQAQKSFKVLPEFKLAVADMRMLLQDIRNWCAQLELGIRARPDGARREIELSLLDEMRPKVVPLLHQLFERFEQRVSLVPRDGYAVHGAYVKRELHPLVLAAPFMHRTFTKPLGYAGDYEMVSMMVRDPYEGPSTFAKILNTYFLDTAPVIAHRNRLIMLTQRLVEEACRMRVTGKRLRVFNLGCGPAEEIQRFIAEEPISSVAEFTLLDFNEETLRSGTEKLGLLAKKHGRQTKLQFVKKSVVQVLKESQKPGSMFAREGFDLVYCAGLFDYLPDNVCQKLVEILYQMAVPGGLVVVTNVDSFNPCRGWMELSVDWNLIYRDATAMQRLIPPASPRSAAVIRSDISGVNIFLEIRKPAHG